MLQKAPKTEDFDFRAELESEWENAWLARADLEEWEFHKKSGNGHRCDREWSYLSRGMGPIASAKLLLARLIEPEMSNSSSVLRWMIARFIRQRFGLTWWVPYKVHKDREVEITESVQPNNGRMLMVDETRLMKYYPRHEGKNDYLLAIRQGDEVLALGDYDAAQRMYSRAIGIDSGDPLGYIRSSQAWLAAERIGRAIEDCSKVIDMKLENSFTYLACIIRGRVYQQATDYKLAEADFRHAIALHRKLEFGHDALDDLFKEKAEFRKKILAVVTKQDVEEVKTQIIGELWRGFEGPGEAPATHPSMPAEGNTKRRSPTKARDSAGGEARFSKKKLTAAARQLGLTIREVEIGMLLGNQDKKIADMLGVSISTVYSHVHSILQKMELTNRTAAHDKIMGILRGNDPAEPPGPD